MTNKQQPFSCIECNRHQMCFLTYCGIISYSIKKDECPCEICLVKITCKETCKIKRAFNLKTRDRFKT